MTTASTPESPAVFQLPDPPSTQDEKMTAAQHLGINGGAHYLATHLGDPETTIVSLERYIVRIAPPERRGMAGALYPDLLVAFQVDPAAFRARNGYVISEQGKPPDFVLEVASRSSRRTDTNEKRVGYAELGIPEYWRFDETGQYHGARLAGDRLEDGRYVAIPIEALPDGSLAGLSEVLNLELRWVQGTLAWHDPATGGHVATIHTEREAREAEREARMAEREARMQAEARVRALEEELRILRGE